MPIESRQVHKGKTVGVASPNENPPNYCRPRESNPRPPGSVLHCGFRSTTPDRSATESVEEKNSVLWCCSQVYWTADQVQNREAEVGSWRGRALVPISVSIESSLTLFLPSSKTTFSQPFKEQCIREVVRVGSIIIFYLSKAMRSQVLHTVWSNISVRLQEKLEIDHSWQKQSHSIAR